MARPITKYSREPREGGILRGKDQIAEYMGCAEKTLDRWYKQEAFPLGKLPNGQWVCTVTLIDTWIHARGILWLKARLKHRPKQFPVPNTPTTIKPQPALYAAMGVEAPTADE